MQTKITAIRPGEYLVVYPIEFPPVKTGTVYIFVAIDVYSEFCFHLETEQDMSSATMLKNIGRLIENKDFLHHRDKGFTLVLHKYEEVLPEMLKIISPYGGKVIFSDPFVASVIVPFAETMFTGLAKAKR